MGDQSREDSVGDERPGTVIGRYAIVRKLGEGGFGAVFMAEQSEPVRRQVALTIIKLGMDTRDVIARFEQERQALALMDHPHIAKVLDAGTTATGRPYFVMELVEGVPITEYCDEHRFTVPERLEIMFDVCQAVQHGATPPRRCEWRRDPPRPPADRTPPFSTGSRARRRPPAGPRTPRRPSGARSTSWRRTRRSGPSTRRGSWRTRRICGSDGGPSRRVNPHGAPRGPPDTIGVAMKLEIPFALAALALLGALPAAAGDPPCQEKLTAPAGHELDRFGTSVSISGPTAVVGAEFDGSAAFNAGAAYVFIESGSEWPLQARLTAGDAGAGDFLGGSVGISGDSIVVGATGDGFLLGAAYVFARQGSSWIQRAKLQPPDLEDNDEFGTAVAISGDLIAVTALKSHAAERAGGAVYVYARFGDTWIRDATLTASDAAEFDHLGISVAASGDTIVAGARDASGSSGAAYVFVRDSAGDWSEEAKLTASDAGSGDSFGTSVALSGDILLVGANGDVGARGSAVLLRAGRRRLGGDGQGHAVRRRAGQRVRLERRGRRRSRPRGRAAARRDGDLLGRRVRGPPDRRPGVGPRSGPSSARTPGRATRSAKPSRSPAIAPRSAPTATGRSASLPAPHTRSGSERTGRRPPSSAPVRSRSRRATPA